MVNWGNGIATSGGSDRRWWRLVRVALPILALVAGLWFAWPKSAAPRSWVTVSARYAEWPHVTELNGVRLMGAAPLVYALLVKTLGSGPALAYVQTCLSVFAWSLLGWVAFRTVGVVLGALLANVPQVWVWNSTVLAESLSFSLMAIALAGVILLARKWSWLRYGVLCLVLAVLAFTRDSNAFLVPVFIIPLP